MSTYPINLHMAPNAPAPASFLGLLGLELRRLVWRRMTLAGLLGSLGLGLMFATTGALDIIPFDGASRLVWILRTATPLAISFASLAAISFVAAEFAAGSMGTWLLFEPRRLRVAASKILAAVIGSVVIALIMFAFMWLMAMLLRGTASDNYSGYQFSPSDWSEAGGLFARSMLLVALFAILGAALAFVLRRTSAVIGLFLGWMLIVEGFIGGGMFQGKLSAFMPTRNVVSFWSGAQPSQCTTGDICVDDLLVDWKQGGIYIVLFTIVVTAACVAYFNQRDVE